MSHTPVKVCSVKVVDCRTMELIPPVASDEEGEPNPDEEDVSAPCGSFTSVSMHDNERSFSQPRSGIMQEVIRVTTLFLFQVTATMAAVSLLLLKDKVTETNTKTEIRHAALKRTETPRR